MGLALGAARRAEGQSQVRTITCESQRDKRQSCSVPGLNESSVKLVDKQSESACIQGRSWGVANNTIWVQNGCRARFSYRTGGNSSNSAGGTLRTMKCSSDGDERNACQVPNLNEASVRIVNKLSSAPCIKGTSWGTVANVIWVSRGCRAEFGYRLN
jgi:hypothetical protein